MTRLPGALLPALGIAALAAAACSSRAPYEAVSEKPLHRSARKMPEWVTRRPDLPGHFVTVGIATGMSSLEEGQRAAVGEAVSEVVTYLGVRAEILYQQTRTELTTHLTEQITARAAARVASGRTVEMYYEVRGRFADGHVVPVHDVYVLVSIPYAELEEERRRLQQELEARRDLAQRGSSRREVRLGPPGTWSEPSRAGFSSSRCSMATMRSPRWWRRPRSR